MFCGNCDTFFESLKEQHLFWNICIFLKAVKSSVIETKIQSNNYFHVIMVDIKMLYYFVWLNKNWHKKLKSVKWI